MDTVMIKAWVKKLKYSSKEYEDDVFISYYHLDPVYFLYLPILFHMFMCYICLWKLFGRYSVTDLMVRL